MNRVYAGLTSGLLLLLLLTGLCWQHQNATGVSNLQLRDICLTVWLVTGALFGVSQLAFGVIALRRKQYVILVFASVILFCIATFLVLLAHAPS